MATPRNRLKLSFARVLYARVSTHDQQTIPLQIRALRDHAAWRCWTVTVQIKQVGSGAFAD